jgi:hypothetical protein
MPIDKQKRYIERFFIERNTQQKEKFAHKDDVTVIIKVNLNLNPT